MEGELGSKISGDSEGVPEDPSGTEDPSPGILDPDDPRSGAGKFSKDQEFPLGSLRTPEPGRRPGSAPEADPAVTSHCPEPIWGDEAQDDGRGSRP